MKLVINGVGPSSMIDILDIPEPRYYPMLHALARACNFLSAYHLMELQTKKFAKKTGCVRLYSDIMNISMFMEIKKNRTEALSFLITTTDYGDSFFVLAVTPMFVPWDIDAEREIELGPEALLIESEQPHAHMLWGGTPIDNSVAPGKRTYTYPPEGLGGCLVRDGYGAIAHFLVLRKMLSRIRRIVHYVDNEIVLQMGAMTAFADMIKAGQCDVVTVGIEQAMKGTKSRSQYKEDLAQMDAEETAPAESNATGDFDNEVISEEEQQQAHQTESSEEAVKQPDGNAAEPTESNGHEGGNLSARERRQIYRKDKLKQAAMELADRVIKAAADYEKEKQEIREEEKEAEKEAEKDKQKKKRARKNCIRTHWPMSIGWPPVNGGTKQDPSVLDLWIKDPLTPAFEPMRRFLWLTRRPHPNENLTEKEIEKEAEKEAGLYLHGTHQPVDTYMNSLRQLISTAERAHLIAATRYGRAGYVSSPRIVPPVISEFILHRFYWNFMRLRRARDKTIDRDIPRAQKLGLNVPRPLTVENIPYIRRKVYDWAEKITADYKGVNRPYQPTTTDIAEKISQTRQRKKLHGKSQIKSSVISSQQT